MTTDSVELFEGRTRKVHTPWRVEASVDLQFGVSFTKLFAFEHGVEGKLSDDMLDRAMHCLVVLIGGKRLLIQPSVAEKQQWTYSPLLRARLYLAERTHGRLVGHTRGMPGYETPLLELGPFMEHLARRSFPIQDVREALNGAKG